VFDIGEIIISAEKINALRLTRKIFRTLGEIGVLLKPLPEE